MEQKVNFIHRGFDYFREARALVTCVFVVITVIENKMNKHVFCAAMRDSIFKFLSAILRCLFSQAQQVRELEMPWVTRRIKHVQ